MTLRFEIETNVNRRTDARDVDAIRAIAKAASIVHGCEIEVNDLATCIRIMIRGNGAVLRDVANALDQEGFLE